MKKPASRKRGRGGKTARHPDVFDEGAFVLKRHAAQAHQFVLDALSVLAPTTRIMFGCLAVYVGEKIVLILRDRNDAVADNGVWLATRVEHHAHLRRLLPCMRSIRIFGTGVTNWQLIPADAPGFEEAALAACALIIAGDPAIGRVPQRRSKARAGARPLRRK